MTCEHNNELLAEALRLGDKQAEELAALRLRLRRLKQSIWRAIHMTKSGKTSEAVNFLTREVRK